MLPGPSAMTLKCTSSNISLVCLDAGLNSGSSEYLSYSALHKREKKHYTSKVIKQEKSDYFNLITDNGNF